MVASPLIASVTKLKFGHKVVVFNLGYVHAQAELSTPNYLFTIRKTQLEYGFMSLYFLIHLIPIHRYR